VSAITVIGPSHIEALALAGARQRDRMHTPPRTPHEAYRLITEVVLPGERRMPQEVKDAVAECLARVVFAAAWTGGEA